MVLSGNETPHISNLLLSALYFMNYDLFIAILVLKITYPVKTLILLAYVISLLMSSEARKLANV